MFRRRVNRHIPTILQSFFIYTFSEVAITKVHLHHKIGDSSIKSLFAIFSIPCHFLQFVGIQFCIHMFFHKMIHDLFMLIRGFSILIQRIKIISIPSVIGKYRKPFSRYKTCLFIKKLAIYDVMSSCDNRPPHPWISVNILTPPVLRHGSFFQRKSRYIISKKR